MSQQTGKKRNSNNTTPPARSTRPARPIPVSPSPAPPAALTTPAPASQPEPVISSQPPVRAHTPAYASLERMAQDEWQRRLHEIVPDIPQLIVATIGALLVGGLYLALPKQLIVGPPWLLLVLEAVLLLPPLAILIFWRRHLPYRVARGQALLLLFVLTAALVASVVLLIVNLTNAHLNLSGQSLLTSGALLWLCNVLVFAVWYWEMDGDGPRARILREHQAKDFRFPQQEDGNRTGWAPGFVDYVFLAFCSATALSPADTMPLTQRAKLLMMAQAVISMLIIVLLVARSVNIL